MVWARLATRGRVASAPPPASSLAPSTVEVTALRACAIGWAATAAYAYDTERARDIVTSCFLLPTNTFEELLREPAAGLLETFVPLVGLEAVLLLGLSSSAAVPRGYVARAKPRDDQQVEEYAQMVDRWTQRKRPK